jgi:signal transduction histidine kinase
MQETASPDVDPEYFETVPLDASDNLAARSVLEGETSLVEDLRTVDVTPADPEYRSALTVPVGDRAVFQAGSKDVGAFDELDRETSEVLAEHARTALENIEARTQLREQQAALERENERLDEFASLVSHDLRNPLTVASGRLADARAKTDSEELAAAAHALDRMDRLIGDLLDLARHGQRVEDVSPVSLEDLVDRCWANVSTEAADLAVESDATVLADEGRLAQLFENLFRNSVEHGRPAGQDQEPISIHVGTLPDGFYVEDDGRGIPEGERERVFETSYTSTEDGTGFGLSIVEQVAAAHGWSVAATESESGGARFEFTSVGSPAREA